jgi:hypothetical protein
MNEFNSDVSHYVPDCTVPQTYIPVILFTIMLIQYLLSVLRMNIAEILFTYQLNINQYC